MPPIPESGRPDNAESASSSTDVELAHGARARQFIKHPERIVTGLVLALVGGAIMACGAYYLLFKSVRTQGDEDLGWMLWLLGGWLSGGGVALPLVRRWAAAVIGLLTPFLLYYLAIVIFWVLMTVVIIFSDSP